MTTRLQPLSENNRDTTLDVLRGFALAGVLFMFCVSDIGSGPGYTNSFLDDLIAWPKYILIESRMYTMLILIFGIGFHVQLQKAKQQNVSLVPVFMRRLMGLLIIGFIHAILISRRDILMFYAIAGFVLLLVRNSTNRQLFVVMLIIFLLLVTPVLQIVFPNPWSKTKSLIQPNNYIDHVQYNWQFFKAYHQVYWIYCDMLFHFLLGFWISRSGILNKIKTNKKFRRSLLIISLAGSAALIPLFYFWMSDLFPEIAAKMAHQWEQLLAFIGIRIVWQLWMMVSVTLYGTILIGLSVSAKRKKWLAPLAAFGQMALSNYLMQSLILVPYLLGFDKYNDIPPFTGLFLFLAMLVFQLLFSTWWMARYTLGPFEWFLRSITYWSWQPIKRPLLTPAVSKI